MVNWFAVSIGNADKKAKSDKIEPEIRVTPTYINTKPKEFSNVFINNTHAKYKDEETKIIQPVIKKKTITVRIPAQIVDEK